MTSLIVVVRSLVHYSKSFESNYVASLDEAHISDIWKDLVSCGFLQGTIEAAYRRSIRVKRLACRYPEALQLPEKFNDEAVAGDSAGGTGGLGTTHFDRVLLLHSEKQNALLLLEAAAVHAKDNTKDKKPPRCSAVLPSISLTPRSRTS